MHSTVSKAEVVHKAAGFECNVAALNKSLRNMKTIVARVVPIRDVTNMCNTISQFIGIGRGRESSKVNGVPAIVDRQIENMYTNIETTIHGRSKCL